MLYYRFSSDYLCFNEEEKDLNFLSSKTAKFSVFFYQLALANLFVQFRSSSYNIRHDNMCIGHIVYTEYQTSSYNIRHDNMCIGYIVYTEYQTS